MPPLSEMPSLNDFSKFDHTMGEVNGMEKTFNAADLSEDLVKEIKVFEEALSSQADKELVVIAYERDKERK